MELDWHHGIATVFSAARLALLIIHLPESHLASRRGRSKKGGSLAGNCGCFIFWGTQTIHLFWWHRNLFFFEPLESLEVLWPILEKHEDFFTFTGFFMVFE
jgi:hypothetical protein